MHPELITALAQERDRDLAADARRPAMRRPARGVRWPSPRRRGQP